MGVNQRHIAHLDMDAFFVSVECKYNSRLKGKPLIVGGGDRGVVAACSYEARTFGIHSAMPMRMAKRLCPQAIVIGGDYELYAKESRLVTEILQDSVPLLEKSSIDEFYMDLTGMDRFMHTVKYLDEKVAGKVKRESDLPITFALATNKLLSKVATNEVKPNGQLVIPFGTEKNYLAPLAVEKMPGVGPKTAAELHEMGVDTIRILSQIPARLMANKFGKTGLVLAERAQGVDESPVVPYHEQKSISSEQTFSQDTTDTALLKRTMAAMVEKIGFDLRAQNKLTGCITVKLRYANFDTVTRQKSIAYSSLDHQLLTTAMEIFEKLYDRRLLVRLIGIRLTDLVPGNYQIQLFNDTPSTIALYKAIDSIKSQFGAGMIMHGGAM